VFDFFFRVNSKIAKDIKKPFKLEGITRIDDTPVHKAVREALVNCLVNTDYFLPCGVVIKKEEDKLVMENPGSIRTGKKQMLRGGISDPRNKILMKMFNMIGIGERAGSGIPDIYNVWENEGWAVPVVEESYNPDRTRLSLEFAKNTLKDLIKEKHENINLETIIEIVSKELNIKPSDIKSKSRVQNIVEARRIIIYLAKLLTTNSMPQIANYFGMKDHSAVSHNIKKINELMESNEIFNLRVTEIKNKILTKG